MTYQQKGKSFTPDFDNYLLTLPPYLCIVICQGTGINSTRGSGPKGKMAGNKIIPDNLVSDNILNTMTGYKTSLKFALNICTCKYMNC